MICSGIGGLAEKVSNGVSGLHFKPGDPLDLLRALKTAADAKLADKLRLGIPAVTSALDMANSYLSLFSAAQQPGAAPLARAAAAK